MLRFRAVALVAALALGLLGAAPARADLPLFSLSLEGPSEYDALVPVTFGGALALGPLGLPVQTVEILVDEAAVQSAQTSLTGTYALDIAFSPGAPFTHTVRAVAYRGTPLETSSPPVTISLRVRLVSIAIEPAAPTVRRGGDVQLAATGSYNNETTEDITERASWTSSAPAFATVSNSAGTRGLVTGVAPGVSTISASLDAVTASVEATVTEPVSSLVINEVDYDQPGTDFDEFVEIYNPTAASVSLDGLALVLVNGSGGLEYSRVMLSGVLSPGGYGLVSSPTVVPAPGVERHFFFALTSNAIQNGAPDGIVLFDTTTNVVVDALSYEGSILSATINGAPGTYNLVEGTPTAAADSTLSPGSLVRLPNGSDTQDASVDWSFSSTPTPGDANV